MAYTRMGIIETSLIGMWIRGAQGNVEVGENFGLEVVQRKMDGTVVLEERDPYLQPSKFD